MKSAPAWIQAICTIGILIVTTWYAFYAGQQVEKTQTAISQAERLSLDDRAPYVFLCTDPKEPERDAFDFSPDKPLRWRVRYLNYGRSPALQVRIAPKAFFGADALAQIDRWFAAMPAILPINGGTVLPPNQTDCQTQSELSDPTSDGLYQRPEPEYAKTHDAWVAVAGRIQYRDIGGQLYDSDFCRLVLATTRVMDCFTHNDIRKHKS